VSWRGISVGIDDIINRAKHLFRGKTDDASDAQARADGTVSGKLAEAEDELSEKVAEAKEAISEQVDDAKVDDVAGSIKDETPDAVDSVVDKIADKAKDIF
jgi:F0F1-type ATP synthase membrane subunit b/b'